MASRPDDVPLRLGQGNPQDLGEVLYRSLVRQGRGYSPHTEPRTFADAVRWHVKQAGGSVSAAARLAGVPRRTFRDWMAGSQPRDAARARGLVGAAIRGERRRRMPAGREQRLRQLNPQDVVVKAKYNYDSGDAARVVEVGRYASDSIINDVIDAYLAGADTDALREEFAAAITDDPLDFYRDTMALPQTDEHGWTVDAVWWEGDPGS